MPTEYGTSLGEIRPTPIKTPEVTDYSVIAARQAQTQQAQAQTQAQRMENQMAQQQIAEDKLLAGQIIPNSVNPETGRVDFEKAYNLAAQQGLSTRTLSKIDDARKAQAQSYEALTKYKDEIGKFKASQLNMASQMATDIDPDNIPQYNALRRSLKEIDIDIPAYTNGVEAKRTLDWLEHAGDYRWTYDPVKGLSSTRPQAWQERSEDDRYVQSIADKFGLGSTEYQTALDAYRRKWVPSYVPSKEAAERAKEKIEITLPSEEEKAAVTSAAATVAKENARVKTQYDLAAQGCYDISATERKDLVDSGRFVNALDVVIDNIDDLNFFDRTFMGRFKNPDAYRAMEQIDEFYARPISGAAIPEQEWKKFRRETLDKWDLLTKKQRDSALKTLQKFRDIQINSTAMMIKDKDWYDKLNKPSKKYQKEKASDKY